jgi:hypothetical protein
MVMLWTKIFDGYANIHGAIGLIVPTWRMGGRLKNFFGTLQFSQ